MLLPVLNLSLGLISILAGWCLGGRPERQGAAVLAAMMVVSLGGRFLGPSVFTRVDMISTTQDLLGFVGFSLLGITSRRVWPLWAAALQLLSVGAHLVRAFELEVRPIVYAWMKSGPTWGVILLLLVGTAGNLWRTRRAASTTSSPG